MLYKVEVRRDCSTGQKNDEAHVEKSFELNHKLVSHTVVHGFNIPEINVWDVPYEIYLFDDWR